MTHIVEYRYRPDFRSPLTEWKKHHKSDSEADALAEIKYLQKSDDADRADGMIALWEKTEYRAVPEH